MPGIDKNSFELDGSVRVYYGAVFQWIQIKLNILVTKQLIF